MSFDYNCTLYPLSCSMIEDNNYTFQNLFRYYDPLVILLCFVLPTILPNLLWSESVWNAFFVCAFLRLAVSLNMTWLVNRYDT